MSTAFNRIRLQQFRFWEVGALKPNMVEALLPDVNADAWIATAPPLRRAARFYPIV